MRPSILVLAGATLVGITGAALHIFALDGATWSLGRALYDANCAACHGGNLDGQPNWQSPGANGRLPAPPHDTTGQTWHHSNADLIAYITLGGAEALAQISVTYDSGVPDFGNQLSANEIVGILDYIKSHWPERERCYQAERTASDGGQ